MTESGDIRRENDRPNDSDRAATESKTRARIERAVGRARLNLAWEALWPLVAPFAALFGLFAIVSWFGLWRLTTTPFRFAVLALFGAAAAYLVFRAARFRWPGRNAGLSRVEQATGALHRPATAYADRLATAPDDPASQALWLAHRQRLLAALDRLKAGFPSPRLAKRDPYAMRFLVLLLFIVGLVYAGPERIERLGEAFRGGETRAATVARIDAWVTPPTYTSRPPIFLTGEAAKATGSAYSVPTGSIVTVRTGGTRDLSVVSRNGGGDTAIAPAEAATQASRSRVADAVPPLEHQVALSEAGAVIVKKGDREVAGWRFVVEPDNPPEVALLESPETMTSGALRLSYSLKDDFGVVSGMAEIAPASDGNADADALPLFDAPTFPLSLPQLRTRNGNGETTRDLTSHPWAGAKVTLELAVQDEAGQEGRSEPLEMTLPARRFTDPLARAVVEQRANLALDANGADRVADALDALTLAPEETINDFGDYLALRTAYYRIVQARDDDDLKALVDYLWTIALGIEDGDLSLAAQRLRDAQEALRQALEDGVSDEDLQRLTDELRQAMQEFLRALAEEAMRNPQIANIPPNADTQMLRLQDLERMLDRIEDLARTGARDAARQLLSELQNMLENLQAGRPMMGDPQAGNQMMESLNQLGEMIRRQEQLMNRTYRSDQGLGENGQPLTPEQLEEALRQLQQGQEGLGQALQELMEQLEGMGMPPNGQLGQAGEAMGRAAEALGEGEPGTAVGDQGAALEALRQGAQGLAQQLANQRGQGGGVRGGDNFPNTDPLGRPQRTTGPDLGTTVRVPDEIDTQRAREILDAIRRRLGDFSRPEIERDYLERLLDRF